MTGPFRVFIQFYSIILSCPEISNALVVIMYTPTSVHVHGLFFVVVPANNDPWFHMFCKWINEFNWLNSHVSVREFTGFSEQIWCVNTCLPWNHNFFTWWHIPVKPYQFWPSTTRIKLVQNSWQQAEHVYSREYTWKHVLVERYQLLTSMTCANWFRNGSLFARVDTSLHYIAER